MRPSDHYLELGITANADERMESAYGLNKGYAQKIWKVYNDAVIESQEDVNSRSLTWMKNNVNATPMARLYSPMEKHKALERTRDKWARRAGVQ